MDHFPIEVAERLRWSVHRVVDPRNGETFYIGSGKGDRVVQHALGALSAGAEEDAADLKARRIKDIHTVGLGVSHGIHRHGFENEDVTFQIEGAVMDAYPGLTNLVGGHRSGDYACGTQSRPWRSVRRNRSEASEPLILVSIGKSHDEADKDIYRAARSAWVIDPVRARKHKLLLAHRRGIVVGVFRLGSHRGGQAVQLQQSAGGRPDFAPPSPEACA